jgi:hypothetical protein
MKRFGEWKCQPVKWWHLQVDKWSKTRHCVDLKRHLLAVTIITTKYLLWRKILSKSIDHPTLGVTDGTKTSTPPPPPKKNTEVQRNCMLQWYMVQSQGSRYVTFVFLLQLSRIKPFGQFRIRITSEWMNPFIYVVGLFGWGIGPSQGLYIHRTTQRDREGCRHASNPCPEWESSTQCVRVV